MFCNNPKKYSFKRCIFEIEMLQKLQKHIDKDFPFLKEKKLLIAISGGIDSVVLTHILHILNFKIALAHCNFRLRSKESDIDECFVKELGKNLNIETFTIQFETEIYAKKHKLSTQIAARELRYNWFDKLVEQHQFNYVLTAHHADDNLETFLINLIRGTGLEGLTGIPKQNGYIIRPLLGFSRSEIVDYAKKEQIKWREDISNAETKYIRNKIRHEIVPKLKKMNPSLLASFGKTSLYLRESQQIIEDRVQEVTKEIVSIEENLIRLNIVKIQQLSNPKAYLYQFLKAYGFTEWNDVHNLLSAQSGKQVFSMTHRLIRDRDFLLLSTKNNTDSSNETSFFIEECTKFIEKPIQLSIENVLEVTETNYNSIFVDKDLLKFPLTLRKWERGDYFCPSGMQGRKKVSKYFKDEKLSLLQKESIWLLCNLKGEIVWIINKRQDSRFMASSNSENIIRITANT